MYIFSFSEIIQSVTYILYLLLMRCMFFQVIILDSVVMRLQCINQSIPSTVWCRYNVVNFIQNLHKRHPIARPLGPDMVCLFLCSNSDLYAASVTQSHTVMSAISCNLGLRYNGTQLYHVKRKCLAICWHCDIGPHHWTSSEVCWWGVRPSICFYPPMIHEAAIQHVKAGASQDSCNHSQALSGWIDQLNGINGTFHLESGPWFYIKAIIWGTIDISMYNITWYCTQHNKFEGKTSARLRTHERQPYLALTGELWVSFVSYLEKIGRDMSGAHCTGISIITIWWPWDNPFLYYRNCNIVKLVSLYWDTPWHFMEIGIIVWMDINITDSVHKFLKDIL